MRTWRVPYPKFGQGPALDRTAAIAERLGLRLTNFGPLGSVIVGSNGKGSTAAMTASLLRQASDQTGLFTSPHLFNLNERFRIGDDDITDEDLETHWMRVSEAINQAGLTEEFGGFEFLFLIAADWFAARDCAFTVWEAGIGGKLDPVRLIEAGRVALTSLDLEHTALLGGALEAIALEKIAAAPPGAIVFIAEAAAPQSSPQRAALEHYAEEHEIELEFTAPIAHAPLPGEHQRSNAALALKLAKAVAPISESQIAQGFAATRWPGRLETLSEDTAVIIDVGHTPEGVAASLHGFRAITSGADAILVCGVSADKDARAIVSALAPSFATIICASAQHKGAPAAHIAAHAQHANPAAEITIAESVADARRLALAKSHGRPIYVAGGLFLAAEFKAVHLGRDPASLAFF
jgi:dihydrofolate synthase/folylpolyglutamate synthase